MIASSAVCARRMAVAFTFALVIGASPARAAGSSGASCFVAPAGSDSADGSAAHPWRTIQRAADAVTPGATVHVAPGVYASGAIESRVAGTPAQRIRFVSDSTWGARIVVTPVERFHVAWSVRGACTDLVGFDVSGDGWSGIAIRADDVRVLGCRVHDLPARGSDGAAGILIEDARRALVRGNVVHDVGAPDASNGRVHGIYLSRGAVGALVQNNLVAHCQDAGIHAFHGAHDCTIANNTIVANGNWGVLVGGARGEVADHFVVTNNIVYANRGAGIAEAGATGARNRYVANLVEGNRVAYDLHTPSKPERAITGDPRFVRWAADGTGDYRLAPDSPCVDAGATLGAPDVDFDGMRRPQGRGVDVGAWER